MRRVVIVGAGSINAWGVGVETFADGLRSARCGVGVLSLFDSTSYRSACAAEPETEQRRKAENDDLHDDPFP